jgi:hypothetical protein
MENKYTGNIYLASLKKGESEKMYDDIKALNLLTSMSLTSGFSYVPKTYTAGDKTLTEPNYVDLLINTIGDGVTKLSDGSYGVVNYDEFKVRIEAELKAYAEKNVKENYETSLVDAHVAKSSEYLKSEAFLAQVEKEANDKVNTTLRDNAKNGLTLEFTKALKEDRPDATDDEIKAEVEALITEEAIAEYIAKNFTEDIIKTLVDSSKNAIIKNATDNITKEYLASAEYKNKVSSFVSSQAYVDGVNKYIADQGDNYVERKYLTAIEDQILAECEKLHNTAIEKVNAAITEFNDKAKSELGLEDKDFDVLTYTDFVEKRIKAQYYSVFKNPDQV